MRYFTHDINGGGKNMYTADNICKMIEFLIYNIFVQFGGCLFCQVIGMRITNTTNNKSSKEGCVSL